MNSNLAFSLKSVNITPSIPSIGSIYSYSSLSVCSSQNCYFYRTQSILGLNQFFVYKFLPLFEFIFGLILLKLSYIREHPTTFFVCAFPLSSSLRSYYIIWIFIFSLFNSVDHCSVFLIIYWCFLLSFWIFFKLRLNEVFFFCYFKWVQFLQMSFLSFISQKIALFY